MKNIILTLTCILYSVISFSQNDKTSINWYSSIEIDFIFPYEKTYSYNDSENKIYETELDSKGFLLNSFGIQYSYNYFISEKLSIGLLTGFQTQSKPKYSMIKLGALIKYFFVDKDNVYIFIQDANNFSFNKDKFRSGNNFRIGLGFPIIKDINYDLVSNLFFEQNYYNLTKSNPLILDEKPKSLTQKSFGLSFGVKF